MFLPKIGVFKLYSSTDEQYLSVLLYWVLVLDLYLSTIFGYWYLYAKYWYL